MSAEPVDPYASRETRNLLRNLHRLSSHALMFGMQDTTGYGVGWTGDNERSDVRDVCGDYPALFGEDLRRVELGEDVDGIRERIRWAYLRGAVVTLSWHMHDPLNRGYEAKSVRGERIVASILPGGARHEAYRAKLGQIAGFLISLRGLHGEAIPVIFRPFHEHTGNWFWWGSALADPEEYRALWEFTFRYLHDSLNVHNLLWAISPALSDVVAEGEYCPAYPGDQYVDIAGADTYFDATIAPGQIETFQKRLRLLVAFARERGKLAALTEVGQEGIPTENWFTEALLRPIADDAVNRHLSYAMVWRNADVKHHYAPYPGHASVPDFLRFYADPFTMFLWDLPPMYGPALDSSISAPIL